MQDKYVGDIGDFGKLFILKYFKNKGMNIGINWFKVNPEKIQETNKKEGGHKINLTTYSKFRIIDSELFSELYEILEEKILEISLLENKTFIKEIDMIYSDDLTSHQINKTRKVWHNKFLNNISSLDMIFCDPDNGIIPEKTKEESIKGCKYVLIEEIKDYITKTNILIVYQHLRRDLGNRKNQANYWKSRINRNINGNFNIKLIYFYPGSSRFFIVIHKPIMNNIVEEILDDLKNIAPIKKKKNPFEIY